MEPTREQIDRLIALRQVLYAERFQPCLPEHGAPKLPIGNLPAYRPLVLEFFRLAGGEAWCDHSYAPQQARAMLEDPQVSRNASLAQVRTMLTCCARRERIYDSHWSAMIEQGHIRWLLDRLASISIMGR